MPNTTFLSKKNILKFLLVLWMVFSVWFIGSSLWNNLRNQLINLAYQQGVTDVVNQLIADVEKNDCKPIPVFNQADKKQVELVSATCLPKPK